MPPFAPPGDTKAGLGAPLPASAYGATAQQRAEKTGLFDTCWVFAGLSDDLAQPNDFLTLELGGTSVMIHNFDGELRALHNVCAHRFAPIHGACKGNRLPRCPYHGWTYNRDGVPIGIPGNAEHFGLDRAARTRLALRAFDLAVCGRFVFVRLNRDGPDLDSWLGPYADLLSRCSAVFTETYDGGRLDWACDWKLAVEGVLEVYHVDMVHADSFRAFTGKGWTCAYHGCHSQGTAPVQEADKRWWQGLAKRLRLSPAAGHADYEHLYIFPNLAVGLTEGTVMSVQSYLPAPDGAPDRSILDYRLVMATAAEGASTAARQAVQEHLRTFNRRVLDEDRAICEQVQRGCRQMADGRRPLLGHNEARIRAFHTAYQSFVTPPDV